MKIVFLTSSYYPNYSAIGKCIYNIVSILKEDNEIVVISNMDMTSRDKEINFEGHKIVRVRSKSLRKRDKLSSIDKKRNKFSKMINYFLLQNYRAQDYFKFIFSRESIDQKLVSEYYEAMLKIKNIDIVVPTCNPFESVIAALKFKKTINNHVHIIPFLFDKFSGSPTLHKNNLNKIIKYDRHLKSEEMMVKNSSKVLYVDSWEKKMKKHFSKYEKKLFHVEHPLISDQFSKFTNDSSIESQYINLIYTGVVDKKIRPPHNVLELATRMIMKNSKIRFHFYVLGNAVDIVKKISERYPKNIFYYGQVSSETAFKKIEESDILLSIGNTDYTLIPSKTFEYMSSGKPILHLYHSEKDSVNLILEKYKLAMNVNQTNDITDAIVDKIIEFCLTNKDNRLMFDEVQQMFKEADPKYISNILMKDIKAL